MRYLVLVSCLLAACANMNDQLFDRYYETYEIQLRPDAEVSYPLLDSALVAYKADDFEEVKTLTTRFLTDYFSIPQVMFAQTSAYMELGEYEEAIANFRILSAHPSLGDKARWYQALAHLKLGQRDAAQSLLRDISQSGTAEEHESAQQLLEDLR